MRVNASTATGSFVILPTSFLQDNLMLSLGQTVQGKVLCYRFLAEPCKSMREIFNAQCSIEELYKHVSICAPYLEVVEEMTLIEFLDFHSGFKPFLSSITSEKIVSILGLENAVNKQIRNYSSGMKQRVKLAQSIFSDVPVVLLDEPCTNLDSVGIQLYHSLINDYCKDRMVVVSSNDEVEFSFCKEKISLTTYK